MSIKITIIGTGQIGASIGMALGAHKDLFLRVGHDKNLPIANRAKALGAVDKVDFNLPSSVEDASIVILALPIDQIHETLQFIADDLKEDAVIMDTAPLKGEVAKWMKEILPPQRHYIGLTPVIGPLYMDTPGSGVEAAHADLFKNGLMAVYLPPGTPAEAVKLTTDFCQLLGAEHMFIDPIELDSMMSATHILPQLLAAALVNTTMDQPGWQDARKLTGRPYVMATGPMAQSTEIDSLTHQAILTREQLLQRMDILLDNLELLRQQLSSDDGEKLKELLEQARLRREEWLKLRKAGNWAASETASGGEIPSAKQVFSRLLTFGGGRKPKQPK